MANKKVMLLLREIVLKLKGCKSYWMARMGWGRLRIWLAVGAGLLMGFGLAHVASSHMRCWVAEPGSAEAMVLEERRKGEELQGQLDELEDQVELLNKILRGRKDG